MAQWCRLGLVGEATVSTRPLGTRRPVAGVAGSAFALLATVACGQTQLESSTQPGTPVDPAPSTGSLRGFVQLSAGEKHACGLRADGSVACWGDNGYGQSTPPAATFTHIAVGYTHSCGLGSDGKIVCWGTYVGASGPGPAYAPTGTFARVCAGSDETCGLTADGTVACAGEGFGLWQDITTAGEFTEISCGTQPCGLRADGSVTCWFDSNGWQPVTQPGPFVHV